MHDSALKAEHARLTERLVQGSKMGYDWVYLTREGIRVRTKLLRYLYTNTSGKFAIGHKYIAFEKEEDAIVYKIAYPQ